MWVHLDFNLKTDSWSAYYRAASDLNFNSLKTVNHSASLLHLMEQIHNYKEFMVCIKKWVRKNHYIHGDSDSLLGY